MTRYNLEELKVLAVDDNPSMLRLLQAYFDCMGVKKMTCLQQPEKALEIIHADPPHLVIIDIRMQPIDGISLAKSIRSLRPDPVSFTPIFMLSALTDMEHVLQALEAGVHEVLAKPVSLETIYKRIQKLIETPPNFLETTTYFGPER